MKDTTLANIKKIFPNAGRRQWDYGIIELYISPFGVYPLKFYFSHDTQRNKFKIDQLKNNVWYDEDQFNRILDLMEFV